MTLKKYLNFNKHKINNKYCQFRLYYAANELRKRLIDQKSYILSILLCKFNPRISKHRYIKISIDVNVKFIFLISFYPYSL